MNRLPYNLANQRSHIGRMATIATILIGVILLLGKGHELTREVLWWLVEGREHSMFFFPQKKAGMSTGRLGGDDRVRLAELPFERFDKGGLKVRFCYLVTFLLWLKELGESY
jgi:hypothetical protein